jgi:hypothetical protein
LPLYRRITGDSQLPKDKIHASNDPPGVVVRVIGNDYVLVCYLQAGQVDKIYLGGQNTDVKVVHYFNQNVKEMKTVVLYEPSRSTGEPPYMGAIKLQLLSTVSPNISRC